jgi:serine/threonine protein phosphatase 1
MTQIDAADTPGLITYAIGDVHGCLDRLTALIDLCLKHCAGRPMRLVFLGDYIDRGPDSRGVINRLRTLQSEMPGKVICLRGNHEALLLEAVETDDESQWLLNGAIQTLVSFGVREATALPREHVDWIAALPLSFDDGRRFFVHAGVDPAIPLDRQDEHDLLWIREPFLSSDRDYGRLIVHGHTPLRTAEPDLHRNRLNLDTAAVYGGRLTAAVFTTEKTRPQAFLNDAQAASKLPADT